MKVSQILDRAADVIERNGHHKGGWFAPDRETPPPDCRVCAGGGMTIAATGHPVCDAAVERVPGELRDAFEVLARHVDAGLPDPADEAPDDLFDHYIQAIGAWNDADVRTGEDVVAMLRTAAASERGEGR